MVKNISPEKRCLAENSGLGIKIANGLKYIGPDKTCKSLSFKFYGID